MSVTALTPRAGTITDIQREDDARGYERDETDPYQRLGTLLLHMVRTADAQIPAGGRAPRTRAEMRARINLSAGSPCQSCGGSGGQIVDTSSDGVFRQHWQTCQDCQACGRSGGGPRTCTQCGGSGQLMVTVCHVGADGTPYQSVEMQTCTGCNGSGQKS